MFKQLAFMIMALCIIGSCGQETTSETESSTNPHVTTTTVSPKTTDPTTMNTTLAPSTTSPEPPATTTTTSSKTTQPTVLPTSSSTVVPTQTPLPTVGKWEVRDKNNSTCIRVQMAVQFKIDNDKMHKVVNLSPNASSEESSCSPPENNTQLLVLEDQSYIFSMIFARDDLTAFVRNISLKLPNGDLLEKDERRFVAHTNKSFFCKSKSFVQIENSTIEFSDVQVQSFMHNEKDFSQAEDCAADDTMNNIVPIAVACALAAMVILILIGYLVTRRQSRQRGYQSV